MPRFSADVTDNITAKLDASKLAGKPVRDLMKRWLDKVLVSAKRKAPKDTGALADSMQVKIGEGDIPKSGSVGFRSDSRKARFVHGAFAVPAPPERRSVAHFPPATQSLRAWANRHGIPVIKAQLAIAKKGTPIVPFLAQAVDEQLPTLDNEIRTAEREIERNWNG